MNKDYLLVDGYNIIFAWKKLNKLAEDNIEAAKDALTNMLCNYQGVKKMNLILVSDAYKVAGGQGSVEKQGGIYIVYTKEAETADSYIEYTTHVLSRDYNVTVATSDGLEQMIITGRGAVRMSARDLYEEVMGLYIGICCVADGMPIGFGTLVRCVATGKSYFSGGYRAGNCR